MKNKKLLSGLLAASMLTSGFSAFAAYGTGTFAEETRTYFYSNTYDKDLENNFGYDMEITADPDSSAVDNKVMHVTDVDGTGKGTSNFYSTLQLGFNWKSQESMGIDGSKKTVSSVDMYLPSGLLNELSEKKIRAGVLPLTYWDIYVTGMTITKTDGEDTFTLTVGDSVKKIQPDTWFNLKCDYRIKKAPVNVYINDELLGTAQVPDWQRTDETGYWNVQSYFGGIGFKSDANMPLTTGFYIDNAAVYEYKNQTVTLNIADGDTDVARTKEFTADFSVPVSADKYAGKIRLTPKESTAVTAAVEQNGENGIKFNFGKLSYDTEYTLTMDEVIDGELYIPSQTVTFTSEHNSKLDTRNYIYLNDYSSAADKTTMSCEAVLASDPEDASNKVVKITDTTGVKDPSWIAGDVYTISPWPTVWESTVSNKITFESAGIQAGRQTTFETDMYLTEGLLDDLANGDTIDIGLPYYNAILSGERVMRIKLSKTADENTFTLTDEISQTKKLNPNRWYNIKFVGTVGANKPISFYVDDELVFTKNLDWQGNEAWAMSSYCLGISFMMSKSATEPFKINNGFYLDNGSIWQIKDQDYTVDIEDGATDVSYSKEFTLTFGAAVDAADYEGKITATAENGSPITASVTQNGTKSLKFKFDGLSGFTAYTLNIASVTKGEASFPSKTITFTTGEAPRIDEKTSFFSYTMTQSEVDSLARQYVWLSDAKLALKKDPTNSENNVVAYTTAGNLNETNGTRGYMSRMDIAPSGKKYSDYGMSDSKTLFAQARFYLPAAALNEMPADGYYQTGLGSCEAGDRYFQGSVKLTKSTDGQSFVLNAQNKTMNIAPDTWFDIKWAYTPNTKNTTVYVNGEVFDYITVGTYEITSEKAANGVRIATPQGTVITDGIYIDDVAVWQMRNAIGTDSVTTDIENGKLIVDFATNPVLEELSKIALKYNGSEIPNALLNPQIKANGHTVEFDIDYSTLALSSVYTVEIPTGFKDVNGQINISTVSAEFTTPKSTNIYIDSYTVTAPSAEGAGVSVQLANAAAAKSAWVVMAVYGKYNELIAIDENTVNVDKTGTVNLSVTENCANAEQIRIYVWDAPETMNPLQRNELAWSK